MFIPYGTDSPIYHWPFATGAMMLITIVAFVFSYANPELHSDLILMHGEGLQPVQWLTSIFMHEGVLHLLGNLVFLWAFGIVVEGKVGPFIFVLIYLGIGVIQCMFEQLMMLPFSDFYGASQGASAAIFGLMMVALVWAPQDNLKIIFNPYMFYIYFIEVPIAFFGLVYFLMDFTIAFFSGFSFGSSLLHLMGATLGLVVGVTFICVHWVDGEEKDLLSMFLELTGKKPIKKKMTKGEKREIEDHKEVLREERKKKIVLYRKSLSAHLAAGNAAAAAATFRQIKKLDKKAVWGEADLLKLIASFQADEKWDQTIEYSEVYIDTYDTKRAAVGINLAKVQLLQRDAPRRALKVVARLKEVKDLTDKHRKVTQQIEAKANQMIAQGAIELD